MNDKQLANSMRSLPRVSASPAFTSNVLRAIRTTTPERHVPFVWRMAAGIAMAACLVAVVHLASMQYLHRQNMAELRLEQQKLEAELEAVRKIASEPEPMVVFEDSQGTRVVMDLESAVQPASYRSFD
jgi:hypothetical protein